MWKFDNRTLEISANHHVHYIVIFKNQKLGGSVEFLLLL